MKTNIGKLKAILERQRNYMSWLQSVMIAILFFKTVEWHWWYLLFILLWPIIMFIDLKFIWEQEICFVQEKSKAFRKILEEKK